MRVVTKAKISLAYLSGLRSSLRMMQCLSKRGVDVCFVGGSTSVLAVGGFCQQGNVAVWDTLASTRSGPIARLSHHASMVTALQVSSKALSAHQCILKTFQASSTTLSCVLHLPIFAAQEQ